MTRLETTMRVRPLADVILINGSIDRPMVTCEDIVSAPSRWHRIRRDSLMCLAFAVAATVGVWFVVWVTGGTR